MTRRHFLPLLPAAVLAAGLPPTLAEVDAFLADTAPQAYERVVERLLNSPRYGEHMARYWMDAVRYADTHGYHIDSRTAHGLKHLFIFGFIQADLNGQLESFFDPDLIVMKKTAKAQGFQPVLAEKIVDNEKPPGSEGLP